MKAPHKFVQWAIVSILFGVGFLAFMVVAGDDNPEQPLPLWDWFMIKGIAAAVIYACYRAGKHLYNLGLLPVMDDDLLEEEDFDE